MPHPYLVNGALGIAILPGLFGSKHLLTPEASLRSVKWPVPTDPTAKKLALGLMRLWGVRNISVAYILSLIWWKGETELLGYGLLGAGVAMPLSDGLVSRQILGVGQGEWMHWGFLPLIVGVAGGLLGWYD